jgi:type IV pilus assembly protein PilA
MRQAEEKNGNGLAIAAVVCSALFCVPLLPLIGLILGIIVLMKGKESGRTLAIVAVAVGAFSMVANVGVLAAIAIPNFIRFQLRSKQSEAKTNLNAIKVTQNTYFSENGYFIGASPEGNEQGTEGVDWNAKPCAAECTKEHPELCNFSCIGFAPVGRVRYLYACSSGDRAFTCVATADLDGDGDRGAFVYSQVEEGGTPAPVPNIPGAERCDTAAFGVVSDCATGSF